MALTKIKNEINAFLDAESKNAGSGFVIGGEAILEITVGGNDFINAFVSVTEGILTRLDPSLKKYNTRTYWNKALSNVTSVLQSQNGVKIGTRFFKFETGNKVESPSFGYPSLNPGVYADILTSTRLKISLISSEGAGLTFSNRQAEALFTSLRSILWDEWVQVVKEKLKTNRKILPSATEQGERLGSEGDIRKGTISSLLGKGGVRAAHKAKTTKASFVLQALEDNPPALSLSAIVNPKDVVKEVRKSLKINYTRARNKRKLGTYVQANIVEVRFERNTRESTDLGPIKDAIEKTLRTRIKEAIRAGLIAPVDEKSSKPLTDAAKEDAIKAIVDSYKPKNTKYKKTSKSKKFEKINDSIAVRKATRTAPSKGKRANLRLKGAVATSTLRGQTGEKKKKQPSLAKLKSLINRRLGAQVRRNMGRPALINQTGRFSNSAELVNLKEGPNTIIGEYTYMANPYRTFENTGQRKWPVGYNPKPLIAKSIRDLALEYTDMKFTLRRV